MIVVLLLLLLLAAFAAVFSCLPSPWLGGMRMQLAAPCPFLGVGSGWGGWGGLECSRIRPLWVGWMG